MGEVVVRFFTLVGLNHLSCKCLVSSNANQETKTGLGLENNLARK